jgi:hypothetical protein
MAQHDMNIANQGFPATRADLNNALQALVSNSSGATAPSTTFANQWWYDTTNNKMYLRNEANNAWIEVFALDQTNNEWQLVTGQISAADGDGIAFKTDDGTTRVTLDDSGNLMVSKTGLGVGTDGFEARASGLISASVTSGTPVYVNRNGSDGEIINIRKSDSTVGSIGVVSGDAYMQGPSNHSGIQFNTNGVLPLRNGAIIDDTLDLGGSSYRWQDLYLSGGAYIGGTAAANKLDDYQEGYHTAVIYGNTTGTGTPLPIRSSHDTLAYTKIGRVVHIQGKLETLGSHSATGNLRVTLPFTVASLTDVSGIAVGTAFFYRTGQLHDNPVIAASSGGSNALFYQSISGGDISTIDADDMDAAIEMFIGLTYITTD